MRSLSLALCLMAFWLALSGHYTTFLISMGGVVTALCVVVARRMGVDDAEGHPIALLPRAILYWGWLWVEIAKSGWSVMRIVLDPRLPISPTMTRVRASQRTAVGLATYANSITLTPGTMTTHVDADLFTVHALVRAGADDVEAGGMNDRVTAFEGVR
ncbi:MAG: Na+/H+ antiporter subunit E [Hyphomicrobiaceae bacterium]|nr:Na+/H+ antiporter subunit E [Hyphomicrobiaceae bacterium]